MKVGDVLIYIGEKFTGDEQSYTKNSHYIIYKIDENYIRCYSALDEKGRYDAQPQCYYPRFALRQI